MCAKVHKNISFYAFTIKKLKIILGKAIEIVCRYDGRMFTYDRIFYAKDTTLTYGGPQSQQQQLLSERFAKRSTRSERPFLPQMQNTLLPWGGVGGGCQFPSLGVIDEVASLVEEWLRVGELRSGMGAGGGC